MKGGEVWFGVEFAKSAAICAVKTLVIRWLCGFWWRGQQMDEIVSGSMVWLVKCRSW